MFASKPAYAVLIIAASTRTLCGFYQSTDNTQFIHPSSDGTLVDGGGYGPFDGFADDWDWTFNESGYEGAIALNRDLATTPIERRLVFEFDLAAVSSPHAVTAHLSFQLRGSTVFPAPNTDTYVYSYPANLQEQPTDFAAGPSMLIASVVIAPFQQTTPFTRDVGRLVNDILRRNEHAVAFRFQINPNTPALSSQAFMDAVDSDPATKPILTIDDSVPGDADGDTDVDLSDYHLFSICFSGPSVVVAQGCRVFDFDLDGDVDLQDQSTFEYYASFDAP